MFIMIGKRTIIENQGLSWKSVGMIILQLFFWLKRKKLSIYSLSKV